MEIQYLGHSSFRIKGKTVTIVTDPYDSEKVGFKFPKLEATIVTISHDHFDHNQAQLVDPSAGSGQAPKVVSGPGEYEIAGVSIFGTHTYHDNKNGEERGSNTVYTITIDGVNICHLGDLGHKLSDEQLDSIGNVDVLLVPVGGVDTIDPSEASQVISQIEPKIIIPMHYKVPGLAISKRDDMSDVEAFVKEIGIEPVRDNKFVITPDKMLEEVQLVVLERRS
ncbi:MAG: beta-lactamase fold-like Zn-dependent hydrolase [Microgenomates group bacterium Gr01-1014_5]|nr:MAG: beta-lactamase fold-like Zn-dependent hydrolase [Microgenomates group bacterium Gr01-1014_5]